ncbi:MAG TPA: hypothetical protein DER64_21335 [Planctomycetaceae bacterium]|nr:hypothetical protein [Planctomycetaceae bacterium]|tara:strand:+ start:1511 stop:2026 length:516 start_codon:yes stop_codon:yes gene_type:complete
MVNRLLKPVASRLGWLVLGIAIGGGVSWAWPSQTAVAFSSDRNDKFAVTTAMTGPTSEAVFVLDFLTGQIRGFSLNRTANQYMWIYSRSIAQDFGVDPNKPARYAMISGLAQPQGRGGAAYAPSYIYVAELSTGRVQPYAIPFRNQRGSTPTQLIPVPGLQFAFAEPRETE